MITTQFRITFALLALAAMASLHVSASQIARKTEPVRIGRIVQLQASYDFNGPKLTVRNLTGQPINGGTRIQWSISGRSSNSAPEQEIKGSFILPDVLWQNKTHVHSGGLPFLYQAKPKAWYLGRL